MGMVKKKLLWNAFFVGMGLAICIYTTSTVVFMINLIALALNLFDLMKGLGWLDPSH